jgi:hypothetical protein
LYHIENFNIKIIFYFVKVIVTSTYLRNNSRMPGSMLILSWVGIIFVIIKILTNIMPTHVKISIEPGIRELFRF